ncbi:MAG: glycoside hydrolase family 3 N-terminal domain-containing protein [Bacteroidota bacterium]
MNDTKTITTLFLCVISTVMSLAQNCEEKPWLNATLSIEERVALLISCMSPQQKASQLLSESKAIPELGIIDYHWWNEALHGVARSAKATVFPQAIGLAATFDDTLVYEMADIISDEARAINNHVLSTGKKQLKYMGLSFWSPNVNIFRDPRWGRGQETYGEDPYLSGRMGAAFIQGMQGNDPKYLKTAACAKHFAVHSGPEALRHSFNAQTNKKDFYETYLPAFEACVDAGVEAVMCAYNRTNDEACCGSNTLLNNILRKDWGFDGHIVSDCGALKNLHHDHKLTANASESAALAIQAGVDINCGSTYKNLIEAMDAGLITEEIIDKSLSRVLTTKFKLGMFDQADENPYRSIPVSVINQSAHQTKALEVAQKSIVLLQNENQVLPLSKDIPFVYLGGPFVADACALLGNYNGLSSNMVTLVEGVMDKVSPSTRVQYRSGSLVSSPNLNPIDWYSKMARRADATIATVGFTSLLEGEEGEAIASNAKGDNLDMQLPESQLAYLRKISQAAKAGNKPLIVVVFAGCPVDLTEVSELADAILYAWYPGEQGGQALADILFGDVSPSGKLPITFPKSIDQLPPYDDYRMTNRTYRYMKEAPVFPFGFGLGYSAFSIEDIKWSAKKGYSYSVSCSIKNQGSIDADEVFQVYVSLLDVKDVPSASLVAFDRLHLEAGGYIRKEWNLNADKLTYFDENGQKKNYKGRIKITISNCSPGIRSEELGAVSVKETYKVR